MQALLLCFRLNQLSYHAPRVSGEEGEEEDEVRITYGEFKHGIQVSLKVVIYFSWILYLPQVGLRERQGSLLFPKIEFSINADMRGLSFL